MARRIRLRRGKTVGKYRLGKRIGSGGFCDVYRARDTVQNIEVALKVLTEHNEEEIEDLEHEVRVASQLDHPNLLKVHNADYFGRGLMYVAYELGVGDLADRMDGGISLSDALDVTRQLLDALQHVHANGVIHCDVKPGNVICFPEGHVKLGDFGLCKRATGSTKTSHPGGTLGFMAPELAMGYPSPRSDLFSVALIAYDMITDKRPDWPFDWPPPAIEVLRKKAPDLEDLFRKALKPDCRERFASANVMLEAFQAAGV